MEYKNAPPSENVPLINSPLRLSRSLSGTSARREHTPMAPNYTTAEIAAQTKPRAINYVAAIFAAIGSFLFGYVRLSSRGAVLTAGLRYCGKRDLRRIHPLLGLLQPFACGQGCHRVRVRRWRILLVTPRPFCSFTPFLLPFLRRLLLALS